LDSGGMLDKLKINSAVILYWVSLMPLEEPLLKTDKKSSTSGKAQQARRIYFKKSLIQYGFTEEQAEILLESLDEFVEEEKDLTEEAKESLYK
jgi:hypothetical protein